MKTSVIGCGRWGSFIAWYLHGIGHEVTLYGREGSAHMREIMQTRSNGLVSFAPDMRLTCALEEALSAEIVCVSIGSQGLRALMADLAARTVKGRTFVLCMKGLEIGTGERL